MKIVFYYDNSTVSKDARAFLEWQNVPFEAVDTQNQIGFQRLLERTQQRYVPAFELKRAHSIFIIIGLNKELLERELGIQKE